MKLSGRALVFLLRSQTLTFDFWGALPPPNKQKKKVDGGKTTFVAFLQRNAAYTVRILNLGFAVHKKKKEKKLPAPAKD